MTRFTRPSAPRIRFAATMLVPAAVALAVSVVWSILLIPDLPDPVATHVDFGGAADGFGSAAASIAGLSGVAAAMIVMFAVIVLAGMSSGAMSRFLAGVGSGSVFLLASLQVAMLLPQAGLADARGFTLPGAYFAAPFVIAIAGGALVAWLVTPVEEPEGAVAAADPIAVSESSRAVWFGSGRASWALVGVMGAGVPAVAVPAFFTYRAGETLVTALLAVTAVVMVVLTVALLSVRVRIDDAGVHWSLFPGFPKGTIRYGDLDDVEAVELKAGDWGGWGYRVGPKGHAILLRGGEGLQISRRNRADLYIGVDDAARGAALAKGFLGR